MSVSLPVICGTLPVKHIPHSPNSSSEADWFQPAASSDTYTPPAFPIGHTFALLISKTYFTQAGDISKLHTFMAIQAKEGTLSSRGFGNPPRLPRLDHFPLCATLFSESCSL